MQQRESPLTPNDGNQRYVILDRIGEGNFAVTYRARDLALHRIVALKLLRPQFAADPAFLTRFAREARAAAPINHPHVVQVYDYGTRDELPFVVLQYIPGKDLKEVIRGEGPRTPEETVRIGSQILRGLAAIHSAGLIHRDIKPQNVLLDFALNAHVSDFGIALNPADSMLTSDGTTFGTPSYMAPEQARGETVTKATDLYAVGVILFEMLTGRLPFNGDNPLTVMLAHVQNTPPSPSDLASQPIPPALEAVVLRALAKNPRDRAASASAMAQELEATLGVEQSDPRSEAGNFPFTLSAGIPANPRTARHDSLASTVATHPVSVARDRSRRRVAAWLAPLGVIALILMIWGGVKAMGFGDGDGDGSNPQLGALVSTTTQTATSDVAPGEPTATVAATRPQREIGDATATARRVNTTIVEPTETTRPIEPTPTGTTEPTAIAPPTLAPKPSRTPRPATATETETIESESQPTIAPSGGNESGNDGGDGGNTTQGDGGASGQSGQGGQGRGSAGTSPVSLSFGPEDWDGGFHRGDSGFLGRPWVAIYGAQSGLGRVTLAFDLDAKPKDELTLTMTGINDEWASPNPLVIAINGVTIFDGPCPFPAWDGTGNGDDAVWGTASWTIPKGVLRKGDNEIEVRNLSDSDNTNSPPYVDISTTTIETS